MVMEGDFVRDKWMDRRQRIGFFVKAGAGQPVECLRHPVKPINAYRDFLQQQEKSRGQETPISDHLCEPTIKDGFQTESCPTGRRYEPGAFPSLPEHASCPFPKDALSEEPLSAGAWSFFSESR